VGEKTSKARKLLGVSVKERRRIMIDEWKGEI
jgi:hypothetical protein